MFTKMWKFRYPMIGWMRTSLMTESSLPVHPLWNASYLMKIVGTGFSKNERWMSTPSDRSAGRNWNLSESLIRWNLLKVLTRLWCTQCFRATVSPYCSASFSMISGRFRAVFCLSVCPDYEMCSMVWKTIAFQLDIRGKRIEKELPASGRK